MPLTERENWFRAVRRTGPEWMPYEIHLGMASWARYGREQEEVVLRHPRTWKRYQPGSYEELLRKSWPPQEDPTRDFVDQWGSVWRTTQFGFVGTVVEQPLGTEEALRDFRAPSAETYNGGQNPVNFAAERERLARDRAEGRRARGGLDHGFFLLRLEYLRGFDNLMCDLMDPSDDFRRLFRTVHELNLGAVRNWLAAGAETIGLPEDLGAQDRSIIGPRLFRRWALPCYKELHALAHAGGALTYFHCDGNILDLCDQLREIAPDVFNPQDRANGVENLARELKGRMCLDLDLDRQHILPFGTPREIEELVEHEVRLLGAPEGGLMMKVEARGDVPPRNLEAVATALEKWSLFRTK
jgi:uroporphyrinogen decarboxylase